MDGWVIPYHGPIGNFPDLNENKTFPAKYDRRHDVSVVLTYEINKKWSIGATWIYATGSSSNLPQTECS